MASDTNGGRLRPRSTSGINPTHGYEPGTILPGGLVIPPDVGPVLADLIGQVNSPEHGLWLGQMARVGGCSHPLHLKGFTRVRHSVTGAVDYEFSSREAPAGVILVRCRNRRAAVCPSCARLYQGDVYHLVRSGLEGGKGIPLTVACHPRVFATLTAPSFGTVHTSRPGKGGGERGAPCHPRRSPVCGHARRSACFVRHTEDDPLVGTPLCPDCYDYSGAVIWQASVGGLWWRFCTYLRRHLGVLGGRTGAEVHAQVRLSYVKIVEFQRRGLVHVHAVIRADGVPKTDPDDGAASADAAGIVEPPGWVTADLLCAAVRSAAAAVRVEVDGGRAGSWVLGWGQELSVDDLRMSADQDAAKTSAYVAKYSTKSTEVTGWDASGQADTPRATHTAAMARTAYALAAIPELEGLRLGRWVKELSYRGHVSSKSRQYSTTLGKLRAARAAHRAAAGRLRAGKNESPDGGDDELMVTESSWELTGFGYSPGQALLAADFAKDVAAKRAAAREAGAARSGWRVGGQAKTAPNDARERGARVLKAIE